MARTQGPDEAQTLHGHTFEVLSPQKTLMFQSDGGMPNSCASSCHGTQVDKFGLGVDPNPMSWNDPFDVSLANELLKYYGPNGLWWKVDVGAGARAPQPALRRAQNRAGHHGVRHHRSTGTAK